MLKVVGASWTQIRISTWIIGIVIAIGIVTVVLTETGKRKEDGNYSVTCTWSKEVGFVLEFWGQGLDLNEIPKGVARAHYDPHINQTGWALFQVETQPEYPDWVQAFSAGMVEGSLSWQMIYWQWSNTIQTYCQEKRDTCEKIRTYLKDNSDWARETATDNKSNPYWHQVYLFYMQLDGMVLGFEQGLSRSRQAISEEISPVDFLWLNALADVPDIEKMLNATQNEEQSDQPHKGEIFRKKMKKGTKEKLQSDNFFCGFEGLPLSSAFVKFVPDRQDLFVAHNSAGQYRSMLKIYKKYQLAYHTEEEYSDLVAGHSLVFSSYPGAINSMDDFIIASNPSNNHKIVLAASSLSVFDNTLWNTASMPQNLLSGPRIMAASRLARNPQEWSAIFSLHNSGLGNKEWLIIDMNRFKKQFSTDVFWVLEQMPGKIVFSDQSATLFNRTYWASYGIPYYEDIFILSGTRQMQLAHGNAFSYSETAVARIFARDQQNATEMRAILELMRSNRYKVDSLQEGSPRCAVGSRGDLKGAVHDEEVQPVGVTDVKVLRSEPKATPLLSVKNSSLRVEVRHPLLQILAGPAFSDNETPSDSDDLAPFSWHNSDFDSVPHLGHPDVWQFPPLTIDF